MANTEAQTRRELVSHRGRDHHIGKGPTFKSEWAALHFVLKLKRTQILCDITKGTAIISP